MTKLRLALMEPAEPAVVEDLILRLVEPGEEARWDGLMVAAELRGGPERNG